MIEKSIRRSNLISDAYAVALLLSKIFISRTFSRRRMIDDDFTVYRVCFLIDIRRC